jgi:hypothetical protein
MAKGPAVSLDAVHFYHDLLAAPALAADSQEQLDRFQSQHGLYFGDRPLCSVLRPRLMTFAQYDLLRQRVKALLGALGKAQQSALASDSFRRQFLLTPQEEELVRQDPGFPCAFPTSRLDAFYVSDGELKFTEFNSETPAGAMYNHALTRLFEGLPIMRAFQKRYQAFGVATHAGVLHALLESYAAWSRRRERPRIAILDWNDVPTSSEFRLFEDYFRAQGLECFIADPREVEYANGKLSAQGRPIDLIYKRVLISELLERCGIEHPVVRAVRAGDVCMINPFRCKILFKKASFAVLTDEENRQLFTPDEHAVIRAHIPWTRRVEERKTLPPTALIGAASAGSSDIADGAKVDLVPFIMENQQHLVLKPNDDYGGKGIVLGWTVDRSAWKQAVETALAHPYIVQARVNLPKEPYPNWIDGKLQIIDRMVDTDPFIVHGEYMEGSLCRISTADLLNVTAGGGSTVPTFLISPR